MQQQKPQGTPYKDMPKDQKIRWVVKLILCILTFGFAFPNIMGE